jgi:hypothetical protein
LGQIYEREGRKTDAIVQYEITLGKLYAMPETRPRLTALLPPGTDIGARITEARNKRSAAQGIKFPNPGRVADNGELWVLLKPGPTVEAVRFISGGDTMKATATDIRAVHFPDTFPDSTAVTLLRRAWVTCSTFTHECHIGLIAADAVVSTK